MTTSKLRDLLPGLETALLEEIADKSKLLEVPGETKLLDPGDYIHAVPLVLEGMVRVSRNEDDKELLLYYINPGEMCIMSFSACCSRSESLILATTLEKTTLLLLPSDHLKRWTAGFSSLNTYVYQQFHYRYLDLINTIDQLIFNRLDERLWKYLSERAVKKNEIVSITHQQIATDLGTAREVISRLIKKFEKEGKLEQGRNFIKIL